MASDLNYQKIKTASEAKAADEARTEKLRRDVMILIFGHLRTEGYHQTADRLEMGLCAHGRIRLVMPHLRLLIYLNCIQWSRVTSSRPKRASTAAQQHKHCRSFFIHHSDKPNIRFVIF